MNVTRTRKISIEVELPPQFLADVLTTAVEGGINYWCSADSITRARGGDDTGLEDLSVVKVVKPYDAEQTSGIRNWADIDLDTIHTGIERLVNGSIAEVHDTYMRYLTSALRGDGDGPDAGEIDSDLADVIVQAGLFGEVVYG